MSRAVVPVRSHDLFAWDPFSEMDRFMRSTMLDAPQFGERRTGSSLVHCQDSHYASQNLLSGSLLARSGNAFPSNESFMKVRD